MTAVIDRSGIVADDWQCYDRLTTPGASHRVLVSSDDLAKYPRYFARATFELALDLAADEALQDIAGWLPRLALVRLNFASFADGRAFSQAYLLRRRYAFGGHIRAHGEVLRDQLAFMYRCGVNQFSLAPEEDLELALAAFGDISESYQLDMTATTLASVVNG